MDGSSSSGSSSSSEEWRDLVAFLQVGGWVQVGRLCRYRRVPVLCMQANLWGTLPQAGLCGEQPFLVSVHCLALEAADLSLLRSGCRPRQDWLAV